MMINSMNTELEKCRERLKDLKKERQENWNKISAVMEEIKKLTVFKYNNGEIFSKDEPENYDGELQKIRVDSQELDKCGKPFYWLTMYYYRAGKYVIPFISDNPDSVYEDELCEILSNGFKLS